VNCNGAQLLCDGLEARVYVAMDDLLDEAQKYRHDDDGFESLSEDDEENANAEHILGGHFVGDEMKEGMVDLSDKEA
jgi:hypothetical protein